MIGTRIGQLVVSHRLGEGGMGAVYAAEHEVLRTRRAIKVLLPEWTQNAMIVQRFVNEARAAASIHHRNIIAIHDCGQLAGGSWYIVMDHLEGSTLSRFRASHGGPLSIHLALELLASIANGLEAAHAADIVHRDLKPDNIFLVRHGTNARHPIILDFGIAKLGERDAVALTRTGMSAGTPAYMAPEQIRDMKVVDRRSDVYALGLIAYEMITGGWLPYQAAFEHESFFQLSAAEIYYRQLSRERTDPRQHVASIPERWAAAVLDTIHPEPSRRPETPRAFALALAGATPGHGSIPDGMEIVRSHAHELLELESLRGAVHPSELGGVSPVSGHRLPLDTAGTPVGAIGSVAESYGVLLRRDRRRSKLRRLSAILAGGVAIGGLLALALERGADRPGSSPPIESALTLAPVERSLSAPDSEPSATHSASVGATNALTPRRDRSATKSDASETTLVAKPEAGVAAPAKPKVSVTAPAKPEVSVTAPAKPKVSVTAPIELSPPPVARRHRSVPSALPDTAGPAAAPLLVDSAETGASLEREWRAVLGAITAVQKSKGPEAADPLLARWRRVNILSAMATPESRQVAARALAEIRKDLAKL
jgi:eukaryotic-like serine/threonine-protein kinase